jgi:hypothetical protein
MTIPDYPEEENVTDESTAAAVTRWRKKPVVIEAVRWTGTNTAEITRWLTDAGAFDRLSLSTTTADLVIHTLEGDMRADVGDYVIRGVKGEFYPCKPGIFAETYEPVAEPPPDEPLLPEGEFGRIELPGYRQHTGWVTEETRFGAQVAVVRDWRGLVLAEVVIGPGSQFVHLPTPLRRPEAPEQAAIAVAVAVRPCGCDEYSECDECRDDERPF